MQAMEEYNEILKAAPSKVYGHMDLARDLPAGLIQHFTYDRTREGTNDDFYCIGRVYEYFIGEFAYTEDIRGVEFYTPKSIISVLGEMPDHVEKAKIIA